MSRRPPLKPIRTVGATDTNFSTSHTLQSIQENEDNVDHCVTSQTPPFEDNNQHVEALSPLPWNYYFQARAFVLPEHYRGLGFRVYAVGSVTFQLAPWTSTDAQSVLDISTTTAARSANTQPLLLFFHGGGYSALSFGFLVKYIMNKLPNPESLSVLAFDARGHGETVLENEEDLSTERQVEDALDLLKSIYGGLESNLPPVVLAGHSMGGAIAVHVGASGKIPTLCGLIVIDVVEGTAVASLPHMQNVLLKRPKSFSSIERAIQYSLESGQAKSRDSCRLTLPAQLKWNEEFQCYLWRTKLEESEPYWKGWFENLSSLFLQIGVPKLLILAGQDRLDKPLTIAQMQGRFQLSVVRDSGHNLHEDQPETTAQIFVDFLRRHNIVE